MPHLCVVGRNNNVVRVKNSHGWYDFTGYGNALVQECSCLCAATLRRANTKSLQREAKTLERGVESLAHGCSAAAFRSGDVVVHSK